MTDQATVNFYAPRSVDELGIPVALVQDIVVRQTLLEGRTSTVRLANRIALSPMVMTTLLEDLRDLRLIEVQGLEGRDYIIGLTDEGRRQAIERMQISRYTGPAPVSLDAYVHCVRTQHVEPELNLDKLRAAFSDLTISETLLREIGPAAMGRGAMFMYGVPGTGKSSLAERLQRIHNDYVLIPYAVEVDSQIISVFDPVLHRRAAEQPDDIDPRWVVCERPFITVGGELTGSQLDLAYQDSSGIYLAPLQMQANNGVLVIDDFGRQALRPDALLNRWIVPLDRGVDYLSLDYGVKFEVPFDVKIVFSTNLEPEELGDEAFYRRIQSKVLIPTISDEQFDDVLQNVARDRGVEITPDSPAHLRWVSRELGDGDLRPYLPQAVCDILESVCRFEGLPLRLDPPMIDRIVHMFFTRSPERAAAQSSETSLGVRGAVDPSPLQ